MFCPVCNEYITESGLIKTKIKSFEGTDIEYDAKCPACEEDIGRMSWGKLTLPPHLAARQMGNEEPPGEAEPQEAASGEDGEAPYFSWGEDEEEDNEEDEPEDGDGTPEPHGYFCPHCGRDLPEDLSQLPRKSRY